MAVGEIWVIRPVFANEIAKGKNETQAAAILHQAGFLIPSREKNGKLRDGRKKRGTDGVLYVIALTPYDEPQEA